MERVSGQREKADWSAKREPTDRVAQWSKRQLFARVAGEWETNQRAKIIAFDCDATTFNYTFKYVNNRAARAVRNDGTSNPWSNASKRFETCDEAANRFEYCHRKQNFQTVLTYVAWLDEFRTF